MNMYNPKRTKNTIKTTKKTYSVQKKYDNIGMNFSQLFF